MKTVLYQGRPIECTTWMVLPEGFVPEYKRMSYEVRELVLKKEADALVAKLVKALQLAVQQNSHDMLMTGEELRQCTAAITAAGAA